MRIYANSSEGANISIFTHVYARLRMGNMQFYAHTCATMRRDSVMKKTPKEGPTGAGRVAFLARSEESAVRSRPGVAGDGRVREPRDNTGLSYSQFARYVGKYIRTPTKRGDQRPRVADETLLPTTPLVEQIRSLARQCSQAPCQSVNLGSGDDPSGNNRDDLI